MSEETPQNEANNIDNFATDVIDKVLQGTQEAFDEKSKEERQEMKKEFESNYYQITFDINLFTNNSDKTIKYNNSSISINKIQNKKNIDGTGKKSLNELINYIKDNNNLKNDDTFKLFQENYKSITGGSKLSIKFSISFQFEIKNGIVGIKTNEDNKFYITSNNIINIDNSDTTNNNGTELKRKNNQFTIKYEDIEAHMKENINDAFDTGSTEQIKNSDLKEIFNNGNFIQPNFDTNDAIKELNKLFKLIGNEPLEPESEPPLVEKPVQQESKTPETVFKNAETRSETTYKPPLPSTEKKGAQPPPPSGPRSFYKEISDKKLDFTDNSIGYKLVNYIKENKEILDNRTNFNGTHFAQTNNIKEENEINKASIIIGIISELVKSDNVNKDNIINKLQDIVTYIDNQLVTAYNNPDKNSRYYDIDVIKNGVKKIINTTKGGGDKTYYKLENVSDEPITEDEYNKKLFELIKYSLIKLERLLRILNIDIIGKLCSLLSSDKRFNYLKYVSYLFIKIDLNEVKNIYNNMSSDNKYLQNIEKFIESDRKKYNFIRTLDSEANYIFLYNLFKGINDTFDDINVYDTGSFSDEARKLIRFNPKNKIYLRIVIKFLLLIEEKLINFIQEINRIGKDDMLRIDVDYFDTIKKYKRVKTIVKRRHDNSEYDEDHPLYKTVVHAPFVTGKDDGKQRISNYLDVYYINDPKGKQLFTYSHSHGRLVKLVEKGKPSDELEKFIERFYDDLKIKDKISNSNEREIHISKKEKEKRVHYFTQYIPSTNASSKPLPPLRRGGAGPPPPPKIDYFNREAFNEKHRFGPFDYLYNKNTTNKTIADNIKEELTRDIQNNHIMMIGLGQSGSGKTSTLVNLEYTKKDAEGRDQTIKEAGILLEYLKQIEIKSIKIECVNLYFKESKDGEGKVKELKDYNDFTSDNYLPQIYNTNGNNIEYNNIEDLNKMENIKSENNTYLIKEIKEFNNNKDDNIRDVGNTILKLFDKRQKLPSPNNDKSSRSHIIVCLTINEGNFSSTDKPPIQNKKLIVCDLAGVENKFVCDDDAELMLFEKQYDALKTQKNNNKEAESIYNILFKKQEQQKETLGGGNDCKERIEDTVDEYLKNENIAKALVGQTKFTEIADTLAAQTGDIDYAEINGPQEINKPANLLIIFKIYIILKYIKTGNQDEFIEEKKIITDFNKFVIKDESLSQNEKNKNIKQHLEVIKIFYEKFQYIIENKIEKNQKSGIAYEENQKIKKRIFDNYENNKTIFNTLTEEFVKLNKIPIISNEEIDNFQKEIINKINENTITTGSAIFDSLDEANKFYDQADHDGIFKNNDAEIDEILEIIFGPESQWINSALYANKAGYNEGLDTNTGAKNAIKLHMESDTNTSMPYKDEKYYAGDFVNVLMSSNNDPTKYRNELFLQTFQSNNPREPKVLSNNKKFINTFLNKEKIAYKTKAGISLLNLSDINTRQRGITWTDTQKYIKNINVIFFNNPQGSPGLNNADRSRVSNPLYIKWINEKNRGDIIKKLIIMKAVRSYQYYDNLNKEGISLSFIEFLYFFNYLMEKKYFPVLKANINVFEKAKKEVNTSSVLPQNIDIGKNDTVTSEEVIKYVIFDKTREMMDNIIKSLFDFIDSKKSAINEKLGIIKKFIATAGDSGECLIERRTKIKSDCDDRVKEGYMINRSLAELSKGISKIGSKYSFGKDSFPLYLEREIDSKCRNQFIDYFTFDKYVTQDNTITNVETDIQEYGIILSIIKHYFGVPLDQLFVYTLLVYNTSFFKAPKQNNYKLPSKELEEERNLLELEKTFEERVAIPYKDLNSNVGHGNNPPNPPYVNINFLKYFCNINQDKSKLIKIFGYLNDFVTQYTLYKPYFGNKDIEEKLFPGKITEGIDLSQIKKSINKRIDYIESFNAATLLGTLETADTLQSLMYKDVGCSIVDANEKYKEILNIYNHTTQQNVKQCKDLLEKTNFITDETEKNDWSNKIEELLKLRSNATVEQRATRFKGGRKTRKKYRKRNKTVGKKVIRFNRSKLRTKKPKKTKRK